MNTDIDSGSTDKTPTPATPSRRPPKLRTRRSRLSCLPAHVREQLNQKLYDGWQYSTIADWLFKQIADRDIPDLDLKTGDPYSLVWTRVARDEKTALETLRYRISIWYRTHYREWLKLAVENGQTMRVLDRVDQLADTATEVDQRKFRNGGNVLIRALLLDAIEKLRTGTNDPEQLIRLAETWSRIN